MPPVMNGKGFVYSHARRRGNKCALLQTSDQFAVMSREGTCLYEVTTMRAAHKQFDNSRSGSKLLIVYQNVKIEQRIKILLPSNGVHFAN